MNYPIAAGLADRFSRIALGMGEAFALNLQMLMAKMRGMKTVVFHVSAATQLVHVESVIHQLLGRAQRKRIFLCVVTNVREVKAARERVAAGGRQVTVQADRGARFLLFCDLFLSVDQGMVFPLVGCSTRVCCFHGQPSKGNVYQRFNYRQINVLFFYGPLMRDHYQSRKRFNPEWSSIRCYDVGQPLMDRRLASKQEKSTARWQLGLDPDRFTIIYAPSFECCSSLSTDGDAIIHALLDTGANVIVKPHPAFYNIMPFGDEFNRDAPNIRDWRERVRSYDARVNCLFPETDSLDVGVALSASDVMLADFSGVAFDGILFDLGMVFWDCPRFFSEYLPRRYGVDGDEAMLDLACNVGRNAGIVVGDTTAAVHAIEMYRVNPQFKESDREYIRSRLLFNPGRATAAMADQIERLLEGER